MPYCSECGNQHAAGDRFCSRCGRSLVAAAEVTASQAPAPRPPVEPEEPPTPAGLPLPETKLWEGQPNGVFNPIEAHAISYELSTERLRIIRGILNRSYDDVELTRVRDVTVEQSLAQRALGVGNVTLVTTDSSAPDVLLHDISEPHEVKEMIRQAVRQQRQRFRVRQFEDI